MFFNCDESFKNAECRFLAVPGSVTGLKPDWSVSLIKIMTIIEILVLFKGLLITTIAINMFLQKSSIHLNFSRIAIAFASHFYVLTGSRIALMLFEIGVLDMNGGKSLTLLVSSIFHIYEAVSTSNLFIGFIFERLFATIYISDYEVQCNGLWVHKRSHISHVIIAAALTLSFCSSILLSTGFVSNTVFTILYIYGVLILAGAFIAIAIYRRNSAYLNKAQSKVAFSLSTKFQLAENFRVFRVLVYIAIIFGIAALSGTCVFLIAFHYMDRDDNLSSMFAELFELLHTVLMTAMNAMFILSLWKRDFQLKLSRYLPCIPTPVAVKVMQAHEAGEYYFNDLADSWDNQLAANSRN